MTRSRGIVCGYIRALKVLSFAVPLVGGFVLPGQATVVTANGTCILGSCTPSLLPANGSTFRTFAGAITVNGDPFQISGNVSATNSLGLTVSLNPAFKISYTGSVPVTHADVLNLVITQQYQSLATISLGTFSYEVTGNFGGLAGSGTSLVVDNRINGKSVGVVTANPPGAIFGGQAANLTGPLVNPLTDTFDYTLTVADGTLPGFFVEVAEPNSAVLLFGAVILAIGVVRRRVR